MAILHASVTVGTTPINLSLGNENSNSKLVVHSGGALYIGGPDVTSSTGLHVANNETIQLELFRGEDVYGVVATGTIDVRVLQNGF